MREGSSPASGSRVPFVSRRPADSNSLHGELPTDLQERLPRLGERTMRLLLLFTALLQAWAWHQSSGYQLADSVEFMDRAFAVARGEALDHTGAVRSFGFSTFLLPFFALAEGFELEEMRWVVHGVRLLQMSLGLCLVVFSARIGGLLGGRQVGYVAGFLVAVNPTFMQYSSDPVSGIAAATFIAAGLNLLLRRCGLWKSVGGGLLLGLAFMMAYQTILISVPIIALVLLRDRWRQRGQWIGAGIGMAISLAIQVVLDKVMYDTWGISIRTYLTENMGGVSVSFFIFIGLEDAQWVRELYEAYVKSISADAVVQNKEGTSLLDPRDYYIVQLPTMLVWPVIAMGAIGLARAWFKINWKSTILVLVFALNVYAMSLKGSKSFRLWLPLLPLIVPLCAWGWGAIARAGEAQRPEFFRTIVCAALLLASLGLGLHSLSESNTRRYGAYWDAMDFVNAQVAAQRQQLVEEGETVGITKVAAAYNWAVFCRSGTGVRVTKLKEHLDQWHQLSDEQRSEVLDQIAELDWLILHGTVLRLSPALNAAINEHFEVAASFWDEDTEPTIRDVRVLQRLEDKAPPSVPGGRSFRRLWEVAQDEEPASYRDRWQLTSNMPQPALFVGVGTAGRQERLYLLGIENERLPGAGFGWITYHWYSDTGFDHDYVLVDRLSTKACPWSRQNNREPGHGAFPTSSWQAGQILRESYLMVPGQRPFESDFKPLGGSFRRGDLLPAMLWVRGESPPPDITAHRLLPADLRSLQALDFEQSQAWFGLGFRMPEGQILSSDRLLLCAQFLLPVDPALRWPDDGRAGPDDEVIMANARRRDRLLQRVREIEALRGNTPQEE